MTKNLKKNFYLQWSVRFKMLIKVLKTLRDREVEWTVLCTENGWTKRFRTGRLSAAQGHRITVQTVNMCVCELQLLWSLYCLYICVGCLGVLCFILLLIFISIWLQSMCFNIACRTQIHRLCLLSVVCLIWVLSSFLISSCHGLYQ